MHSFFNSRGEIILGVICNAYLPKKKKNTITITYLLKLIVQHY
jgi:hypothetical protein